MSSGLDAQAAMRQIAAVGADAKISAAIKAACIEFVHSGSIGRAMMRRSDIFPRLFGASLLVGEITGRLPERMEEVARTYDELNRNRRRARTQAIYPVLVATIALAVGTFGMIWVIPQFVVLYRDFSGGIYMLPLLTRIVIAISDWMVADWPVLFLLPAIHLMLLKFRESRPGRFLIDPISLRIPPIRRMVAAAEMARFTRAMATCLSARVPILEAIAAAKETVENVIYQRAIGRLQIEVAQGTSLSHAMRLAGRFPAVVRRAVKIGEEAGDLECAFTMLADNCEKEARIMTLNLRNLVEPGVIIAVGAVVATVVISLYLPMFNLVGIEK